LVQDSGLFVAHARAHVRSDAASVWTRAVVPSPRFCPETPVNRSAPLFLAVLLLAGCSTDDTAPAGAFVIETLDQRIGGPASDTDVGDIAMENGEIRVGLLGARCDGDLEWKGNCASPGPGMFSGSMVDLDLNRRDGRYDKMRGQEAFSELFASVNLDITETRRVEILADGSDGPAVVRSQGPAGNYISYIELLSSFLDLPRAWQVTDFILEPGDRFLTLRTHATIAAEDADGALVEPAEDPCGGWVQGSDGLPCDGDMLIPAAGTLDLVGGLNGQGIQMGDFFFAGGDVDIFVPGIGFDEGIHVNQFFLDGNNSISDPFTFPFVASTGDGVSYAMGNGAMLSAPLFTSSLTAVFGGGVTPERDGNGDPIPLPEGFKISYERYIAVGQGDVASALDALYDAYIKAGVAIDLGEVTGRVIEETTMDPLSGIDVVAYLNTGAARNEDGLPPDEDIFSQFGTDVGMDELKDGSFGGRLPVGDYLLVAKVEDRAVSVPVPLTVEKAKTTEVGLVVPRSARLVVQVTDERGEALPSKISLRPHPGTPANITALGDPFYAGGFSHVAFLGDGMANLEVPPGTYDVFVTRGPEYSIWSTIDSLGLVDGVTLGSGQSAELAAVLTREVDSTGFIAADLHVHSAPSHDSGVSLALRTLTMVAEGVEFFASTDHDVITEFRPVIEELGLDRWVQATAGLETTTIELGHFLAFPLSVDYTQPSHNGSIDWVDMGPQDMIDGLRDLGLYSPDETAVFVGHPRDGILGYFDQYGLDPMGGSSMDPLLVSSLLNSNNDYLDLCETEDPAERCLEKTFTLDFDGLELLNGKRFDLIRTPTTEEMTCFAAWQDGVSVDGCDGSEVTAYGMANRTLDEQRRMHGAVDPTVLEADEQPLYLAGEPQGQIDDWFTLLNLGYRHTVLGNSDTHGLTKTESGCPRNYVVSAVDAPEAINEREVALAVKEHRVVASYGPLIDLHAEGMDFGIGSDVSVDDGDVTLFIDVQAPRWMKVDRVELHQNGELIREWDGDAVDSDAVMKFSEEVTITGPTSVDLFGVSAAQDAWYVVSVIGDQDLAPLYQTVEVPPLQLNDVVIGALGELDLPAIVQSAVGAPARFPQVHPVHPYAITNPIWVDFDGDGTFRATGEPSPFLVPAPEE
jgi:hypothetical protein